MRICLINQKGGCGKSSTCFHLGGYFAQAGLNTLLVDCDPQASLSNGFFGSAAVESLAASETLAAIFDEDHYLASPQALVVPTQFDRLSIVRANQLLAPHNVPQPERLGLKQYALREFLNSLCAYDVCVIDCPPNIYGCSWTAMIAASATAIPVPPEDPAAQGLRVVHQAIDNARLLNPNLLLLGHLVTRCDKRLLLHRSYESKLRQLYGEAVLATVIPEASAFKVALACRTPVNVYSPKSPAARLTADLGRELLSRASVQTVQRRMVL